MAVHTSVFFNDASVVAAAAAYVPLSAAVDQVLGLRSNNLVPSTPLTLVALAATGMEPGALPADPPAAVMTGARIQTPRTLVSPVYVRPVNVTATFGDNPNVACFAANAVMMRAGEEIAASVLLIGTPGTGSAGIVAWFRDRQEPVPASESYWVPFTVTASGLDTGKWTMANTFSFNDTSSLPAGRYAVLGMHLVQQNADQLLCGRLVIPGAVYRPGALVLPELSSRTPLMASDDSLGVWGHFDAQLPPTLELFAADATVTTATITGYLRIAQVER